MAAIYERHASSVEEFVHAFAWEDGQSGAAFVIGDRAIGLDLFDHPEVMRRYFPKLVRSYALDALDAPSGKSSGADAVTGLVSQIGAAQTSSHDAVGLGKDIRLDGSWITGAALWAKERYIHICAFGRPQSDKAGNFWARITRPSRRRLF
jgi:hypothetical protein